MLQAPHHHRQFRGCELAGGWSPKESSNMEGVNNSLRRLRHAIAPACPLVRNYRERGGEGLHHANICLPLARNCRLTEMKSPTHNLCINVGQGINFSFFFVLFFMLMANLYLRANSCEPPDIGPSSDTVKS